MNTSVNIVSVNVANKKVTKALSNINPEVSNANLKQAAQLFTAISNTTYQSATRISTMDVNEEYDPSQKTEPILSVAAGSGGQITYNGDGELFVHSSTNGTYINPSTNSLANDKTGSFSGKIYASEGATYAAKTIDFTVPNN